MNSDNLLQNLGHLNSKPICCFYIDPDLLISMIFVGEMTLLIRSFTFV